MFNSIFVFVINILERTPIVDDLIIIGISTFNIYETLYYHTFFLYMGSAFTLDYIFEILYVYVVLNYIFHTLCACEVFNAESPLPFLWYSYIIEHSSHEYYYHYWEFEQCVMWIIFYHAMLAYFYIFWFVYSKRKICKYLTVLWYFLLSNIVIMKYFTDYI